METQNSIYINFNPQQNIINGLTNTIINTRVINPLVELEGISTDIVTNYFFSSSNTRYNFYQAIKELFEKYKKIYFIGNNQTQPLINTGLFNNYNGEEVSELFYLIFKGGNIINSAINYVENKFDNINIFFEKTKRSDSDFSIYIKFNNILSNEQKDYLIICANCLAYDLQQEIQNNYDPNTGNIEIDIIENDLLKKKVYKITDIINVNSNQNKNKTIIKPQTENLEKYEEIIKYNDQNYKIEKIHRIFYEYLLKYKKINNNRNINDRFDQLFLLNEKNYQYFLNDGVNNKGDFRLVGIKINDNLEYFRNKKTFNYVTNEIDDFLNEEITDNTYKNDCQKSLSFTKLRNIIENTNYNYVSGNRKDKKVDDISKSDKLILYTDNNKNLLLLNEESLNDFYYDNLNLEGFNIANQNINTIKDLLNNNQIIYTQKNNINGRKLISNKPIKKYPNNLFVSSNLTTKFIKHIPLINESENKKIASFNLIRTKHNIRLYFLLENINNNILNILTRHRIINRDPKIFFYIDLPGEFIDISIPSYVDTNLQRTLHEFDEEIKKKNIILDNNNIYTYSRNGLIKDLVQIIIEDTENKPWDAQKKEKRIERVFRLFEKNILYNHNLLEPDNNDFGKSFTYRIMINIKDKIKIFNDQLKKYRDDSFDYINNKYIYNQNKYKLFDINNYDNIIKDIFESLILYPNNGYILKGDDKQNESFNTLIKTVLNPLWQYGKNKKIFNYKKIKIDNKIYDQSILDKKYNIINNNDFIIINNNDNNLIIQNKIKKFNEIIDYFDIIFTNLIKYQTPLNFFIKESFIKDEIIDDNIVMLGGYYHKYLKYKQKYLALKNNIKI